MRIATDWKDYKILETANGEKLERIGGFTFLRPDPQVIWNTDRKLSTKVDACYKRTENKSGEWKLNPKMPKSLVIERKGTKFHMVILKLTNLKMVSILLKLCIIMLK